MSAHPLDKVFPAGEIVSDWYEDHGYMRGVTRKQAEHEFGEVEPVWVVYLERCPTYGDWPQVCCGGECEGGPVWQVVNKRVPGARRAWRSA